MFRNLGSFLDSLDNVAKETFEEPQISATVLRSKKKEESEQLNNLNSNPLVSNYVEDNDSKDYLDTKLTHNSIEGLTSSVYNNKSKATNPPQVKKTNSVKVNKLPMSPIPFHEKNIEKLKIPFSDKNKINESKPVSLRSSISEISLETRSSNPYTPSHTAATSSSSSSFELVDPSNVENDGTTNTTVYTTTNAVVGGVPVISSNHSSQENNSSSSVSEYNPLTDYDSKQNSNSDILLSISDEVSTSQHLNLNLSIKIESDSAAAENDVMNENSKVTTPQLFLSNLEVEKDQYKQVVKKKNQEIEKLNQECLELEELCASLKLEVREAWESYKQVQDKAMISESELQDEIKHIQKAKLIDKQQLVAQVSKLNEDLNEAMKQISTSQTQRNDIQIQLNQVNVLHTNQQERLNVLRTELLEAKNGTVHGMQALQEEFQHAQLQIEQMRSEHSTLLRKSQIRLSELEQVNAELSESLTKQQKEITKLHLVIANGKGGSTSTSTASSLFTAMSRDGDIDNSNSRDRDYFALQQKVQQLNTTLEMHKSLHEENERKFKWQERDNQAIITNLEEECHRNTMTINALTGKLSELENLKIRNNSINTPVKSTATTYFNFESPGSIIKNDENTKQANTHDNLAVELDSSSSLLIHTNDVKYEQLSKELQEQRVQTQNLSKLLLRKQENVLELQAERSTLKSRLADLQAKCTSAEQQLMHHRDADIEDDDDENPSNNSDSSNSMDSSSNIVSATSVGLQLRRGNSSTNYGGKNSGKPSSFYHNESKLLTNLEKIGVKPSLGVTRAINMIDAWTVLTGRFLRNYPLARLGFVFYLLLLHIWVLVVLVIQTHSLEVDSATPHQLLLQSSNGNHLRASQIMN